MEFRNLYFDQLESTNKTAKALAALSTEGTFIIAKKQSAGRGSGQRNWHSPSGGLYLSAIFRCLPEDPPTALNLIMGVGVASWLRESLPTQHTVSLKWPNDCLVDDKKVAGILGEAVSIENSTLCIVGLGLNINTPRRALTPFENRPFSATSIQEVQQGKLMDMETCTKGILEKMRKLYSAYLKGHLDTITQLWEQHCNFMGKPVEFTTRATHPICKVRGTMLGISPSGSLILSRPNGDRKTYAVGELTCCL